MKHEFLDHHRSGNSIIHRADPRLKLIMLIIFILIVVITPYHHRLYFLFLASIPVMLALISRISVLHFLSKLLKVYPMIFFISFLIPFFPSNNDHAFHFGMIKIYQSGLDKFISINIKSILSIFMSIILTTTTSFDMLLKGMEKLFIPKIFILILSFMYRFIFLLIDEIERMFTAYKSRYIKLPFWHRLNILSQQIVVLFIRTYERGERVYQAMDARGFSGKIYTLNHLKWKVLDNLLLIFFLLMIFLPLLIL
jgi:cobalt/nickel transport system permease protein